MDVSIRNLELLQFVEKEENKRQRKRNQRKELEDFDDVDFQCRYRLTKNTVSELLPLIEHQIQPNSHLNQALSPLEQLLVALRFYATGTHQLVVGDLIKVSQPTVSRVLHKVSKAIALLRPDFIKMPETEEECIMVLFFPPLFQNNICILLNIIFTFLCRIMSMTNYIEVLLLIFYVNCLILYLL